MQLSGWCGYSASLLILVIGGAGCRHATQPTVGLQSQRQAVGIADPTPPPIPDAPSKTPVKDAVDALLSQNENGGPVPHGTRLLHASVESRTATLDFSREFGALANSGDSNEAEAQRLLRSALARVPGVDKMRVTVEGKPFDSQATDWNTPFPVRDAAPQPAELGERGAVSRP